jgi:predicted nucleic acid-binding protein
MELTSAELRMCRTLIDTNILIYAKDSSSVFHKASLNIFSCGDELFLTSKNLTEYFSVVTKGVQPLLTPAEVLLDLTEFIDNCKVLYPNNTSQQKLSELILKYNPKGLLIHDFEIASIGIVNGVNRIATFNDVDFKKIFEIEVIDLT